MIKNIKISLSIVNVVFINVRSRGKKTRHIALASFQIMLFPIMRGFDTEGNKLPFIKLLIQGFSSGANMGDGGGGI